MLPKARQIQLSLGAAILMAGLLAGCGRSNDDATPTPAPTDTPAAAAAPTDTPEPTAASETAPVTETQAMTESETMTETQGMTETAPMTETEAMTETAPMTETEGMTETSGARMEQGAAAAVTLDVADDANLGSILVDQNGMTLYMFDKDEAGQSNCIGSCLEKWPPLLVQSADGVSAGSDAVTGEVSAIETADGSYQVTYAGHPLYTYFQDSQSGDVNGQGVGEAWWVLSPDGQAIGK
ncbi:MAG: hypothetical protein R3A44_00355 [Caldilineaceae bacterium]